MKEILHFVEHRQCSRHINQNLQKHYNGSNYNTLFWRAPRSKIEQSFKIAMKEVEMINPNAHKYLMDKDLKTWSLSFYQPGRCCAAIVNGMCEIFSSLIVVARKKPLITMLAELRLHMMEKLCKLKLKG